MSRFNFSQDQLVNISCAIGGAIIAVVGTLWVAVWSAEEAEQTSQRTEDFTLEREIRDLRSELADVKARDVASAGRVSSLEVDLTESKSDFARLAADLETSRGEVSRLASELENSKAEQASLKNQLAAVQIKLRDVAKLAEQQRGLVREASKSSTHYRELLQDCMGRMRKASERAQSTIAEIEVLASCASAGSRSAIGELQAAVNPLSDTVARTAEIADLAARDEALLEESASLRGDLAAIVGDEVLENDLDRVPPPIPPKRQGSLDGPSQETIDRLKIAFPGADFLHAPGRSLSRSISLRIFPMQIITRTTLAKLQDAEIFDSNEIISEIDGLTWEKMAEVLIQLSAYNELLYNWSSPSAYSDLFFIPDAVTIEILFFANSCERNRENLGRDVSVSEDGKTWGIHLSCTDDRGSHP